MPHETRIKVESDALPPLPPDGPFDPFEILMLNASGCRGDDEETGANRWSPILLDRATYGQTLKAIKPRFRGAVKDHLTGKTDSMLQVDVTFDRTTNFWVAQLLERVPELKKLLDMVKELERLKQHLANQPAVRTRLERLLKEPASESKPAKKSAP